MSRFVQFSQSTIRHQSERDIAQLTSRTALLTSKSTRIKKLWRLYAVTLPLHFSIKPPQFFNRVIMGVCAGHGTELER